MEAINKFNFSKNTQKNEIKIRNKLLNSLLKLSYLENNNDICNLIFNGSTIFNNPYDGYTFLSNSETLQNLLKFNTQKSKAYFIIIIRNILLNIQLGEMMDLFDNLKKKIFTEFNSVNFFFDMLLVNINNIKIKEQYINEKIFDIISEFKNINNIKKETLKELLNNDAFRNMIYKAVFLIINTKGKYDLKKNLEIFKNIYIFLKILNEYNNEENYKLLLNKLFKLFFIELYKIESGENMTINEKYLYIENISELSDLEMEPQNCYLFNYFENIIILFTKLSPVIEIIKEIIYYLDQIQYSYYQIFLREYRLISISGIEKEIEKIKNNYLLCFFFHIFKSNALSSLYYYLIKYARQKNSKIFDLFQDFKIIIINSFNLCPFPFYIKVIHELLKDKDKLKINEIYLDEIMETILSIESIDLNKNENIVNTNKYKMQYYNVIALLKLFFYLTFEPKAIDDFYKNKIIRYFLKFRNILKENNLIFSNYLITLYNGEEKVEKTILEICFIITLSFISTEKDDIKINDFFEFFENKDRSCKEYGESLFSLFDKLNKNNEDIKDINYYKNNNFEIYMNENKYEKQEKSLLIIAFINLILLKTMKKDNRQESLYVSKYKILLYNEITYFFNKSSDLFQKTKTDQIYDTILDYLTHLSTKKKEVKYETFEPSLKDIVNKNNKKKLKDYEPQSFSFLPQYYFENKNYCIVNNKCLLSKRNESIDEKNQEKICNQTVIYGDYFDIDLNNVIKYFKSDLIFKDSSLYFNDIFFYDKNFDSIRKSFLIKYKDNLKVESNRKLFDYPCKIKNYSSNKYALPKTYLRYDPDYYKSEFFSICHPSLNLNTFNMDLYPIFPTHYDYYDLFKSCINDDTFSLLCEFICAENIISGKIYVTDKFILFMNENNFNFKNIKYIFHSDQKEIKYNKKLILIRFSEIDEIISRSFLYNNQAFEVFLKNGKSYFFNLYKEEFLNQFYSCVFDKSRLKKTDFNFSIVNNPKKSFDELGFTKKWENGEIDTFQYLLYINKYSGRTFNDLNQYPIFPWIFLSSSTIIQNKRTILRNMKYFMMTQYEAGKEFAKNNYKNTLEDKNYKKDSACHFTIHYSTAAFVLFFLLKISPYTEGHIQFQNGEFDTPDRLISSIDNLLSVMSRTRDNRELIPEIFTTVEFLYNLNYIYLGKKKSGEVVNDTIVSDIFNSKEEFIYYNRLILNNQNEKSKSKILPKCEINKWIDLVFGAKQFPGEPDKLNKFPKSCYRQIKTSNMILEKYLKKNLTDEKLISSLYPKFSQILNFGQCPEQMFKKSHEPFKNKEKKDSILLFNKKLSCFTNENKIITFWIGENKNIFFLIKENKNDNKKMFVKIYDGKLNENKCQIIIDKIKMFCCKNEFFTKDRNIAIFNQNNDKYECTIPIDHLSKYKSYNSFLVLGDSIAEVNNNDEYTDSDLIDSYALNPKDSMFDLYDDYNAYLFVGRNNDNSIKIYTIRNTTALFGLLKTDSFVSVIYKINKKTFLTGHGNGKLLKWKLIYKEYEHKLNNESKIIKKKKIHNIILEKEIIAHKYMISCMNYNERHDIILSSDIKGFIFIRKFYDFELINRIEIQDSDVCFTNKIFLNDYDIICTVNYNIYKFKNFISFYSLNGTFLERSQYIISIDNYQLKNGKMIFNCLKKNYLSIFGFNTKNKIDGTSTIVKDEILHKFTKIGKENSYNIKNFTIDNSDIYLLLRDGSFIKIFYDCLESLSYGIENFKNFEN